MPRDPQIAFWRATQRLSAVLLLLWLLVTLLVPWFARDTHGWMVFGFPFGYGATAAGALLVYLAIVVIYSLAMDRLERRLQDDRLLADAVDPAAGPAPAERG